MITVGLAALGGATWLGLVAFKHRTVRLETRDRVDDPRASQAVVMLGDSLMWSGHWPALLPDAGPILNAGVKGNTSSDVLARLRDVTDRKPRAILLMIGTNDLVRELPLETAVHNVDEILERIRNESPRTTVTLLGVLPVAERTNRLFAGFMRRARPYNARLRAIATQRGVTFLDYGALLADRDGQLRPDFTDDGVHLRPAAYQILAELLRRDVPALQP